jgi:predicted metal-binding membrane protein
MNPAILETVLRRDRIVVAVALFVLTALAWAYVLFLAATMSMAAAASPMPGMDMASMNVGPANRSWQAAEVFFPLAMWAVMMVGMMTPSAAPMILLYARVGRQARAQGKPFAAAGWFAGGYLLAWTGFAALASLTQAALANAALITPMLRIASTATGGAVLIAAGLYQFTPLKYSCLSQCQAPLQFLQRQGGFRSDSLGSLQLGLRHGLYCIGCCWALMALLFVGGVMNVLWIAVLSVLVLLEKILPSGRILPRAVGVVLIAAGAIFLYRTGM